MDFLSGIWDGLLNGLEAILRMYEGVLEPVFGQYAWGISIILLTLTVRLFLVPLAIRQTKSMRAMQKLQPELKKIQKKYEVDRSLLKTDPERYKAMKEKQREAQMALYQEHQVNPVGGCLPLILQMPIFLALFNILRQDAENPRIPELVDAPWLGIDSLAETAASGAGIGAIILVVLQIATTYYSTRQMQGRNATAGAEQQQAQKLMMYIMPAFLGFLSWTFPTGLVLYWVTTNFWTIGQQALIFRRVEAQEAAEEEARQAARAKRKKTGPKKGGKATKSGSSSGGSDGSKSGRSSGSSKGESKPKATEDAGTDGGAPADNGRPSRTNKAKGTSSSNGDGSSDDGSPNGRSESAGSKKRSGQAKK